MAGKIQNEDVKTEAELVSAGGTAAQLINDSKIWISALGLNKTLDDAIVAGDIGGGGGYAVVEINSNVTLASGNSNHVDTSAARSLTMPLAPSSGDTVRVVDKTGTASSFPITLLRNSQSIQGLAADYVLESDFGCWTFEFGASGWRIVA